MHFNAIANQYDASFTDTPVGRLQREQVWRALLPFLKKTPQKILELNCGTGEDALRLAELGHAVLATDAAEKMLSVTAQKAAKRQLPGTIQTRVCPFSELSRLDQGLFDLVFSNFGGFNCIPPEALKKLCRDAAEKLRDEGLLAVVVMGRFCAWETLYFLLKGRPASAFRRMRKTAVAARLDAETTAPTWYYSRRFIQSQPGFTTLFYAPVGSAIPPSYLNPFFEQRPRLLMALARMEQFFFHWKITFGADHYFICLQKQPTQAH